MTPVVKISHVLVGVDFDEASASALKVAGALAAAWDVVRRSPRPAPTILAAGGDGTAAEAWVDVLRMTLGGEVVRQADIHQCAPDRVQNADVIVLSMAADVGGPARFGAIVQVLKECVHPVLFVPSADGILERSSS